MNSNILSIQGPARYVAKSRLSVRHVVALAWLSFALVHSPAAAQSPSPAGAVTAPSMQRTPSPPNAAEYFIDLKDGDRVPLKLHVRLGLINMGIAPAGVDFPDTGHHHIIIDAPLPPFNQPIPSDDNHVHLGAGTTETDIDLAPGPHTLQLMMADMNHMPHDPPVYSKLIHVIAAVPRTKAPSDVAVYFITPRDEARIDGMSTIRFGLRGMGVAPASVDRGDTGYHNLVIDAATPDVDLPFASDDKHRRFDDGATETDLTLPPGTHTLQLVFTDRNGKNFDPPIASDKITVEVRPTDTVPR